VRPAQISLGLAAGEPRYNDLEQRLAGVPVIAAPTITLEGDANFAPHPEPADYAAKSQASTPTAPSRGGVGHDLPQEAPHALVETVLDVDGFAS
jgi:hypothetical protein